MYTDSGPIADCLFVDGVCSRCGYRTSIAKLRRNCPARSEVPRRNSAEVKALLTICQACNRYPCLAEKNCGHENAVYRLTTECPARKWPA